jgi:hypothetical protein
MVRVAMNRSYDIVGTVTPTQHSTMAFAPQGADAENSEVSSSTVRGQANWDTQTSSIGDQKV